MAERDRLLRAITNVMRELPEEHGGPRHGEELADFISRVHVGFYAFVLEFLKSPAVSDDMKLWAYKILRSYPEAEPSNAYVFKSAFTLDEMMQAWAEQIVSCKDTEEGV